MALRVVILIALLASSVILNCNGIEGGRCLSVSTEEDLELERQLNILNKPAVKSIKTKYGDIYDCVDFYKQPAFDHPLLKDHIPKVKPKLFLRETIKEVSSRVKHVDLGLEGGGCPSETVPIRRTSKEDLIRAKAFAKSHSRKIQVTGKKFAGYQTKAEGKKYRGGASFLSLYNPSVSPKQYSEALMWVEGGRSEQLNHVQVGWTVNPMLYGDHQTRMFGHWTADASQKTGCFNNLCPGFIQINSRIPISSVMSPISVIGKDIYVMHFYLFQHQVTGDWWLYVGPNVTEVGFWSGRLFTSIHNNATVVGWRGEVYAPPNEPSPPMGSGKFPTGDRDLSRCAFFGHVGVYINGSDTAISPLKDSLAFIPSLATKCFRAQDVPYVDDDYKHTFFFGGPGGDCNLSQDKTLVRIMVQTALIGDINLFFPLFLLPLLFLLYKHFKSSLSKGPSLPPGPSPWPIIGNIHQMGRESHVSFTHLAQTYGPLISLRLGPQLLVVASSPATATEILKAHDNVLSGRFAPQSAADLKTNPERMTIAWAPECNDQWKNLRTLYRSELFSGKVIESQAILREKKVMELISFLSTKEGEVVNIGEVIFATVFNILSNLFLSKDLVSFEDDGSDGGIKQLVKRIMVLASTPDLGDLFPIFKRLDIQRLNKRVRELFEKISARWENIIKERRARVDGGISSQQDFLDVLINHGFTDGQINNMLHELFTAGTDTSATTIEWAMAELMKNQAAMNKVHDELKREMGDNFVKESDLPHLHYLHACVKETLRLHPPAPFLLPHRAIDTCTVMTYTIPKDSLIFVNAWAIGRDPAAWDDPLAFKPERFLESDVEFKGNHFQFIPFGAGRRICPGLPMASRQIHFILASLIHSFDWSLPQGMHPANLDTNDKFGIMLRKKLPLLLIPEAKHSQ
ncbi:probable (S)-N-methylcoclaurine 3'-hydroxylase isozyme 2 [Telopea speciosissima]|uniref:probable (S)-N-methylcoclaurine 3'-hydroxylase isozyme 2 n=1 Tax=Telopea speciosissima TaxID=54955 RepID=UPI001CC81690|nr:probable (S)-N-methylcoclaurine 3'-hydroxylase isozyme 2 [Telopea speciosissima]